MCYSYQIKFKKYYATNRQLDKVGIKNKETERRS